MQTKADSWHVISQMKNKRSQCLAVTLPEDQLIVVLDMRTSVGYGHFPPSPPLPPSLSLPPLPLSLFFPALSLPPLFPSSPLPPFSFPPSSLPPLT